MACNLLDSEAVPPEEVEARVAALAAEAGIAVLRSYRIGATPERLLALAAERFPAGKSPA